MKHLIFAATLLSAGTMQSQCISNPANVYSFTVSNVPYEIVKENKNWADAAECATLRGGKLAEIGSKKEQDSIFHYLNKAGIVAANTVAPDGGGASYVWLGGSDARSEGNWFWDGWNMGSFDQFWQGTRTGTALNGHYTNWGNEPDNFNNQDGLGLAVTNWPLGLAGQWNDVDDSNTLYYIIEHNEMMPTSIREITTQRYQVFPNPTQTSITVQGKVLSGNTFTIIDQLGAVVLAGTFEQGKTEIDISGLSNGIYVLIDSEGESCKFVKNN